MDNLSLYVTKVFSIQFFFILISQITKTAEAWTMDLRDVFMHINGRDHFFKKMILTANWWPKKTSTKDD